MALYKVHNPDKTEDDINVSATAVCTSGRHRESLDPSTDLLPLRVACCKLMIDAYGGANVYHFACKKYGVPSAAEAVAASRAAKHIARAKEIKEAHIARAKEIKEAPPLSLEAAMAKKEADAANAAVAAANANKAEVEAAAAAVLKGSSSTNATKDERKAKIDRFNQRQKRRAEGAAAKGISVAADPPQPPTEE